MALSNADAALFRMFEEKVKGKFETTQAKFDAIQAQNEALRQKVEALESRDLNVEALAGKRIPYRVQIDIDVAINASAALTGTVTLTRSGPFIARRLYASFRVATVQSGGTADWVGRYLPLSSREAYCCMDYWRMNTPANDTRNPPLDFEWAYSDGGSDRNRQDRYISGDILARNDESGFMMADEIFASGATITFVLMPLRPVGGDGFWSGATGVATFRFQATFDGYRIVQPLTV